MLPPAVTALLGAVDTTAVGLLSTAAAALAGVVVWLGQRLYSVQAEHAKELRELAAAHSASSLASSERHAAAMQAATTAHAAEIAALSRDRLSEVRSAFERDEEDHADRLAVAKLADMLPRVVEIIAEHAPSPTRARGGR